DALAVPSRHLGLVTAAEHAAAVGVVARWADAVAAQVDLDAVLSLAAPAPSTPRWEAEAEVTRTAGEPAVAMAGGPAFTFGYAEHADLLAAAGATMAAAAPPRAES